MRASSLPPLSVLTLILGLSACDPDKGECAFAAEFDLGSIEGEIDGEPWTSSGASYHWTSGLDLDAPATGGWTLSLIAQTTTDGQALQEAVDGEAFPFDVSLAGASAGGWVLMYHAEDGTFNSQDAASGSIRFEENDGEGLWGCLSFSATNGVRTMEFSNGGFRVAEE